MPSTHLPASWTPGLFSCYLCKEKKRMCDKCNPCSRCVRLGVKCVMQRRSRGRPPRRATRHPSSQTASMDCSALAPDMTNAKPIDAPASASSQHTTPSGDVPNGRVNPAGASGGAAPECADINIPEEHRHVPPITAPPQAPPQAPLPLARPMAPPMAPINAPSPLSGAPPRPYRTPLDVLSSVAITIAGAFPSSPTTTTTAAPPSASSPIGGTLPTQAGAESASFSVHPGVPLGMLPTPRRSEAIPAPDLVALHRDRLKAQAGQAVPMPMHAEAPRVPGPWEGGGQQAWGGRGQAPAHLGMGMDQGGQIADQLVEAFSALCTGVTRLRTQGQLDIRKAEFVWRALDVGFCTRDERFAGPQLVETLEDAVRRGEAELRKNLRRQNLPRLCDALTAGGSAGGLGTGGTCRETMGTGAEMGRAALTRLPLCVGGSEGPITFGTTPVPREEPPADFVYELFTASERAGVCFGLHRSDVISTETVQCNEAMCHIFASPKELQTMAQELHTTIPTVLAMRMTRQAVTEFFLTYAESLARDVQEAHCTVTMRDRCNNWIRCLATLRWRYTFNSAVVAVYFTPVPRVPN